jgi:UDP-galactopyranose mutase
MDELSNFKFAPPTLRQTEVALLARADAVFTGGMSLYEAKKDQHDNIRAFPSSVDMHHFHAARANITAPADQTEIPRPRLGYCGVIDERLDLDLIRSVAAARPELSFVFLGPIAKISPEDLPKAPNIHYLGRKAYSDLPAYLAGWDVALMPFALNEATRFISPTKTPEYLAAGRPVVSTHIADVARGYSEVPGVFLSQAADFATACDAALELTRSDSNWLTVVDGFLAQSSWDATFQAMSAIVGQCVAVNVASISLSERPAIRIYETERVMSDLGHD